MGLRGNYNILYDNPFAKITPAMEQRIIELRKEHKTHEQIMYLINAEFKTDICRTTVTGWLARNGYGRK